MEARIPFSGFYESFYSHELDEEETRTAEHLAEEHQVSQQDVQEILWRHSNVTKALPDICEAYADSFNVMLNDALDLDLKMDFVEMTSPKYYNFETDRIFVKLSTEDAYALYRRVGKKAVRKMARKMFTSRDGFISHYDPDIDEWGQLRTWDYNQLYALMNAAVKVMDDEEWDIHIYYDLSETCVNAYSKTVDWQTVMFEIGKLIGAKEKEEELLEEDDGKRFPQSWLNTQDYIKKYEEMNKCRN